MTLPPPQLLDTDVQGDFWHQPASPSYRSAHIRIWAWSRVSITGRLSGRQRLLPPWLGAQKSPTVQGNLWLSECLQRPASPELIAWAAALQPSRCQAISWKCPQLGEQDFRNGPVYWSFKRTDWSAWCSVVKPSPSFFIHNTEHNKLDGHVTGRSRTHLSLTGSHPSTSQDNTHTDSSIDCKCFYFKV